MEFCPECGCRLEPKKTEGSIVLACSKCSYIKQAANNRAQAKVVKVIQPTSQPFYDCYKRRRTKNQDNANDSYEMREMR